MKYKIASLPGDGIGPEVAKALVPILNAVGEIFSHQFEVTS